LNKEINAKKELKKQKESRKQKELRKQKESLRTNKIAHLIQSRFEEQNFPNPSFLT
jgi:hypothetical protein